jgi:hypothetical protein
MANMYYCSDGSRVSEAAIKARYTRALRDKHSDSGGWVMCHCGCKSRAVHNDHTIARARCKVIHKTELIWNPKNFESSCEKAHREWENFKSGDWLEHGNVEERLAFLKEHDPEGFRVRIILTKAALDERREQDGDDSSDLELSL